MAQTMKELIAEGKIKYWGISNAPVDYIRRAHTVCPVSAIEDQYSMVWRKPERDLFPMCDELDIGFMAYSPLGNGFLSCKMAQNTQYQVVLDLISEIAERKNASSAQIVLSWELAQKPYIVPIPGTTKSHRLEENFKGGDIELNLQELADINQVLAKSNINEAFFNSGYLKMKTTILVVHPNILQSRVNSALANGAKSIADTEVRYLYDLYPGGRIDVQAEQAVLEQADRIILQFPVYWYSSPALLKQWLDDVLTYGWAYGGKQALKDKELTLAVTTGDGEEFYQKDGLAGHTVSDFLVPYETIASYLGMNYGKMFVTGNCLNISDDEIAAQITHYQAILST